MRIVDVNVLLYSVNADAPQYKQVLAYWDEMLASGETIALSWPVIVGYIRTVTNARVLSRPLTIEQAVADIDVWMSHPNIVLISPKDEHWTTLRPLLVASVAIGNLTTDAHLAVLAIEHGATMVSCDGDFSRFKNLRWENPLAI